MFHRNHGPHGVIVAHIEWNDGPDRSQSTLHLGRRIHRKKGDTPSNCLTCDGFLGLLGAAQPCRSAAAATLIARFLLMDCATFPLATEGRPLELIRDHDEASFYTPPSHSFRWFSWIATSGQVRCARLCLDKGPDERHGFKGGVSTQEVESQRELERRSTTENQGDSQQYHRVSTLLVRDMPRMRKSMQSGLQSGSLREELYSESPQPACVARPGTRAVDNQSIHPKVQAS